MHPIADARRGVPRPVSRHRRRAPCARRAGSLLVLVPVILVLVLSLGVLAVDVGRIYVAKSQLQAAADAAALSGAAAMGDVDAKPVDEAIAAAGANRVLGDPLSLSAADVEYGTWNPHTRTFTPLTGGERRFADAVRVTTRADGAQGSAVELLFGSLLGIGSIDLRAEAIAYKDRFYTGFIGIDSVALTGDANVDSYDATDASYPIAQRSRAQVMSNGPITIGNSVTVRGDVRPGPGYTAAGGAVTGSRRPLPYTIDWPLVTAAEYAGRYDNGPISGFLTGLNINISSDTVLTFPAGTYLVNNVNMTGKSKIHAAGKVVLYVTGTISMAGGASTATGLPGDLEIRVIGNGPVTLNGSSDFYGHVYAPDAPVTLSGTSGYFGMFVGETMEMVGTSDAHHDESHRTSKRSSLVW